MYNARYALATIGENLRNRRKELGFTQEKLSAVMNNQNRSTTRETISAWESSARIPSVDNLIDLCNALDCDMDYLLGKCETAHADAVDIVWKTGLSEKAVELLKSEKYNGDMRGIIRLLNTLIEQEIGRDKPYPLLSAIRRYVMTNNLCDNEMTVEKGKIVPVIWEDHGQAKVSMNRGEIVFTNSELLETAMLLQIQTFLQEMRKDSTANPKLNSAPTLAPISIIF